MHVTHSCLRSTVWKPADPWLWGWGRGGRVRPRPDHVGAAGGGSWIGFGVFIALRVLTGVVEGLEDFLQRTESSGQLCSWGSRTGGPVLCE